jgi:hypothetical protein
MENVVVSQGAIASENLLVRMTGSYALENVT